MPKRESDERVAEVVGDRMGVEVYLSTQPAANKYEEAVLKRLHGSEAHTVDEWAKLLAIAMSTPHWS